MNYSGMEKPLNCVPSIDSTDYHDAETVRLTVP